VGDGPVAVGRKPVGTSGCIHSYFALELVVCDGGGTKIFVKVKVY
jgi:hypothetical protein